MAEVQSGNEKYERALEASVQNWCTLTSTSFWWPKQVPWLTPLSRSRKEIGCTYEEGKVLRRVVQCFTDVGIG
jgi:hypothetical protein